MLSLGFYGASGSSPLGVMGGGATGTIATQISVLAPIVDAPGEGEGDLWAYSKHYVNVTGWAGVTSYVGLQVTVLSATYPDQIFLAPASSTGQNITGSYHYGPQTGLPWSDTAPTFVQAQGWDNAITLYNGSGVYGGTGTVTTNATGSWPFWVARRFSENYAFTGQTGTQNFILGFSAVPL
jgi:hypothetical protein